MNTPLKVERIKREMTGESLAKAVGLTQSYITKLENGTQRPSPGIASRIALYLGNAVTRDQILFPEDYVAPEQPSPRKPIRTSLQRAS